MPAAAAYCRVSTATQAESGLSLAEQEKKVTEHARAKGWDIVTYVDRGVSGRRESRPELDRMMADAERGLFEFLIVSRLDRLGRKGRNLYNLLHDLGEAGVAFVCLSPEIDTSTGPGRAAFGIFTTMAEFESDMIAERIKPILRSNAESGKHHARPPFGYETKDKLLVANPTQAPIVQRIFKEKAAGESQRAIAQRLNAENVLTATGATWDPSNIGKILKNRKYVGEIETAGEVFKGKHAALVDDETWRAVEALREANKATAGKGRGRIPKQHLFVHGHLRCGLCGGAMVPRTKGANAYYQCRTRKEGGVTACSMGNVPRKALDEAAWGYFAAVGIDHEATRERELEAISAQQAVSTAALKAAKKAVRAAEAEHKRVKDQVKSGDITAPEWRDEWRDELEQAIKDAKARVAVCELAAEADPVPDNSEAVQERLAEIRASVSGSIDSEPNIAAARAGIRRMFESFTIAPDEPSTMTAVEREVADAQAAEFDDEPLLEVASKAQRWIVLPEPRLEIVGGQHAQNGSDIGFRPVLAAPLLQGDNESATMLTA